MEKLFCEWSDLVRRIFFDVLLFVFFKFELFIGYKDRKKIWGDCGFNGFFRKVGFLLIRLI